MPAKLIDSVDKEEAAIASIDSLPDEGDMPLVDAAKNGNRQAFEVLVTRHEQRVRAIARHFTRVREDAEDITQQSFQKAFLHLHQFEGRSSFSTWLTRVAINEARMLQRRSRGLREVSINEMNANEEAASVLEIPDSTPDPEANYSQRERVRMLSLAMNELTPRTRKAIQLREFDELSSKEAARIMGITVSALKGRVFHGRQSLRETLERYVKSAWMSGREAPRTNGHRRPRPRHWAEASLLN